jgi:hypothetical protein
MSDKIALGRRPMHLWVIGIASLLWNTMGIVDFTATNLKVEGYIKQLTPEMLAYVAAIPAWAIVGWGLGTWGAFLGSVGLLLRKKWSVWVFALSLAGLALSTLYTFGLSDGMGGGAGDAIFMGFIWVIAILLLLYARAQARRGVLA